MKAIERGFDKSLLLLPGWATDERVFEALDLNYNYLIPEKIPPDQIMDETADFFYARAPKKISIFGWSMGSLLAQDIFARWPDRIDHIVFVSARKIYDKEKISMIKGYLRKNKRAYLRSFYQDMFSENEKEAYSRFKITLAKDYINNFGTEILIEGLEYLERTELKPDAIARIKCTFIHGCSDKIAPIDEVLEIHEKLPNSKMIVFDDSGHMPFLREDFKKVYESHDR